MEYFFKVFFYTNLIFVHIVRLRLSWNVHHKSAFKSVCGRHESFGVLTCRGVLRVNFNKTCSTKLCRKQGTRSSATKIYYYYNRPVVTLRCNDRMPQLVVFRSVTTVLSGGLSVHTGWAAGPVPASTVIGSSFISSPTRCPDASAVVCLIELGHVALWFPVPHVLIGWFASSRQVKNA